MPNITAQEWEQKFRRFIKMRQQGRGQPCGQNQIMRSIEISKNTYYSWCKIDDNEELFLTVKHQTVNNRKTTPEDDLLLRQVALQNNWSTVKELRALPEITSNERLSSVCDQTILNILGEQGVKRRRAAVKELLRLSNRQKRLQYANQFVTWGLEDWARVIFIDEFHICSSDIGQLWVWREANKRFEEQNIATLSHTRRFTVSFIVFFSFHGIAPLKIVDRLTKETFVEYLEETILGQHFDDGNVHLLYDNHPAHNSDYVKTWITQNIDNVQDFVLPHPSISAEINPCEQVEGQVKD